MQHQNWILKKRGLKGIFTLPVIVWKKEVEIFLVICDIYLGKIHLRLLMTSKDRIGGTRSLPTLSTHSHRKRLSEIFKFSISFRALKYNIFIFFSIKHCFRKKKKNPIPVFWRFYMFYCTCRFYHFLMMFVCEWFTKTLRAKCSSKIQRTKFLWRCALM